MAAARKQGDGVCVCAPAQTGADCSIVKPGVSLDLKYSSGAGVPAFRYSAVCVSDGTGDCTNNIANLVRSEFINYYV